ncbi:MAG TPA: MogA/MoaB family molybdenum cofactor biosynthesis protein [Egibacteraceae bacterium]
MRAAVITVSNRAAAGTYADEAGPAVAALLREAGFEVADVVVVPDGLGPVGDAIVAACADADVVVTCGGTGLSPLDVTPEATRAVVERPAPGFAEAMRAASREITPLAVLSRGVAGIRGRTLVLNLPGSPRGAVESLQAVIAALPHAVDQLHGGDHPRHRGHGPGHGG